MRGIRARRFGRDEAGATAVEFALVAVPLLLLLLGAIEISRMMWTREALHSVAIAGARCMGVREAPCAPGGTYDEAATETFIRDYALVLKVPFPDDNAGITVNNAATAAACGAAGFSQVTLAYRFESFIRPLLEALDVNLAASACFPNQP